MRASFYERTGPAGEVLSFGQLPTPEPGPGEARVRLAYSGANPSDVKSSVRDKAMMTSFYYRLEVAINKT